MPEARSRIPQFQGGSVCVASGQVDWTDHGDGFPYKELMFDADTGIRTLLMKLEPGSSVGAHAHEEAEQIYVLEGEFHDQERTYRAGDLLLRMPGTMHTAASREGALILITYFPSSEFGAD